jgi:hypothetical protein
LPLVRGGFVPHHVLELFGVSSPWFWLVVAGAAVGATLLAAFLPWRDTNLTWSVRIAVLAGSFALAMIVPLQVPDGPERADLGQWTRYTFANDADFGGRDRLPKLREEAERYGARGPCLWAAVARTERLDGRIKEAHVDDAHVGTPAPPCTGLGVRFDDFLLRHATTEAAPPMSPEAAVLPPRGPRSR